MPIPYGLFMLDKVTEDKFYSILASVGGAAIDPMSDDVAAGRLSKGKNHVWVFLKRSPIEELEKDEVRAITQQLGAVPATKILLDVSREKDSEKLALKLAEAFCNENKCVVYDFDSKVLPISNFDLLMRNQ